MITLFRATEEKPQFANDALRTELLGLEKERDNGPAGEFMIDAFQRMGKDKYVRLVELRGIIKEQQFFCDNETQLRASIGFHKFLTSMQVPDELALAHVVKEEEILAVGEKPVTGARNFAFVGDEIAANYQAWVVEVKGTV